MRPGLALLALALGGRAAAAAPTLLVSGGLAIRVDGAGNWTLSADGSPWLVGGRATLPVAGLAPATQLVQVAPPTGAAAGRDAWGAFRSVTLRWGIEPGGDVVIMTSIRAYDSPGSARELIVFRQEWPGGWAGIGDAGASAAARDHAIAPFPTFFTNASGAPDQNSVQWSGCQLDSGGVGHWSGSSPPQQWDDQQTGAPVLIYDAAGRATAVAPASNFMVALHATRDVDHGFDAGVKQSVASLPPGFAHETVLVGGASPQAALDALGDALRALSGKPRTDAYADFVLSHVGYWTDYGGVSMAVRTADSATVIAHT